MGRLDAAFGWLPAPAEDAAPVRVQLAGSACDVATVAGATLGAVVKPGHWEIRLTMSCLVVAH